MAVLKLRTSAAQTSKAIDHSSNDPLISGVYTGGLLASIKPSIKQLITRLFAFSKVHCYASSASGAAGGMNVLNCHAVSFASHLIAIRLFLLIRHCFPLLLQEPPIACHPYNVRSFILREPR
jgi:hypothetical protein